MTSRGLFITLEGIEGAGKSSALRHIEHWLTQAQIPHTLTREPGGTRIGEQIRDLFLHLPSAEGLLPETEALLLFAARAQHIQQVIQPALARGEWVISDRFTDATYAYQGGGRGLSAKQIATLETWVQGSFRPDYTLLLDVPPEVGLARTQKKGGAPDRIESEHLDFFIRARRVYLLRAAQWPHRYVRINADQPLSAVHKAVEKVLTQWV